MEKVLRWGILGCARIAKLCFIPALKKFSGAELYAIASRTEKTAQEAAAEFGFSKAYASYEELLADPNVDIVYVPVPNSEHMKWAIKAMECGKNVLCEKPMAMDDTQVREMVACAKRNNVFLMEAFMYRFMVKTDKLMELLQQEVIGDVRMVKSSWRFLLNRPNTIKVQPSLGGGSLYDIGCYPVSLINLVYGNAEPVEVRTLRNLTNGVDESINVIMKYENGAMAQFDVGFDSNSMKCTEISGSKGCIVLPETYVDDEQPIIVKVDGEPKAQVISCPVQDRYEEEVKAVSQAIWEGRKELISFEDSLANAKLLDRILKTE